MQKKLVLILSGIFVIFGALYWFISSSFTHCNFGNPDPVPYTKMILREVRASVALFHKDCGRLPKDLERLLGQDTADCQNDQGPYLKRILLADGWKRPISYSSVGDGSLISYGEDGVEGGKGKDMDMAVVILPYEFRLED